MATLVIFILILGLLVFVHEFGHFLVARTFGMKVNEFGLGFPPRAFGWYTDPKTGKRTFVCGRGKDGLKETIVGEETKHEYPSTLYTVNWLPLGGFVRIKGETGEKASEADSFAGKPAWQRTLVLVAGVTMNFLLAAIVLGIGFMIGLPADTSILEDKQAILVGTPHAVVQQVEEGSPADLAGLRIRDAILSINGEIMADSRAVQEFVAAHSSDSLSVVAERGGEELTFTLVPSVLEGMEDRPRIGVLLLDAAIVRYPWYLALFKGFGAAFWGAINITLAFALLIKNLVLGQGLAFDVAGPVGIAVLIGESARLGISYLLNITAMISLSLAVINILPIPALDGGRVLFIAIEKLIRRPVPMKYEQLAHTIGFVLLMALIVVVTWRDIVALF